MSARQRAPRGDPFPKPRADARRSGAESGPVSGGDAAPLPPVCVPSFLRRTFVLCCCLLTCFACMACTTRYEPGDPACPERVWRDVAEIVRCEPAPPSGDAADPSVRSYVVEFRIVGDAAPEDSAVRRRTTPFLFTLGAGGLPGEDYVRRNGLTTGAKLPVIITEGFPVNRWTYCGGVRMQFEGVK